MLPALQIQSNPIQTNPNESKRNETKLNQSTSPSCQFREGERASERESTCCSLLRESWGRFFLMDGVEKTYLLAISKVAVFPLDQSGHRRHWNFNSSSWLQRVELALACGHYLDELTARSGEFVTKCALTRRGRCRRCFCNRLPPVSSPIARCRYISFQCCQPAAAAVVVGDALASDSSGSQYISLVQFNEAKQTEGNVEPQVATCCRRWCIACVHNKTAKAPATTTDCSQPTDRQADRTLGLLN